MIPIMMDRLFADIPGASVADFDAGATVFKQGDEATAIYQVRTGVISLVRHGADGSLLTVATASANETFAEASLFASHYHCDAVARAPSSVLSLPSNAVRAYLGANPDHAMAFAEFLSAQVRDLRGRLEMLRIKRAPERVMAWLQWRARGEPPMVEAGDAWSRVASELGLTPEVLYRTLSSLEKSGLIARNGRRIVLQNAKR
jgi:CRP/FNR family transcriptional regulator, dissimilatory nitrate respiration regulator